MKIRISAGEAARNFSDLLGRVRYRGESFLVERGGKPVCEISPAGPTRFTGRDLANLLRELPHPGEDYLALVEALGREQPAVAAPPWPR